VRLTERAYAVLAGGGLLWVASRVVGSPDLHVLSVGILALVPLGAVVVFLRRHRLEATRRLSTRRAFPGGRVRVDIEVRNRRGSRTPFLLLEDRIPAPLGTPARLVIPSVAGGGRERASYEVTARRRGRYAVGPLVASVADPFDLARHRIEFEEVHDVVVYPEVEELEAVQLASPVGGSGESASRQLFRTGEDFYTMRQYEMGDDLRRIHWPSTARTGSLMIRQDETARRAAAVLYVDTRRSATGGAREPFERAVSAAASIGSLYLRTGYSVRLATPDLAPQQLSREQFLEALALMQPSRSTTLTPSLRRLRGLAGVNPSLVLVMHAPDADEVAALTSTSLVNGPKLGVLLVPREVDRMYLRQRTELDRRIETTRLSMVRAGWEVIVLDPNHRLSDVWQQRPRRPAQANSAASS
jgi:uncharacterized protein (DUF58 family)